MGNLVWGTSGRRHCWDHYPCIISKRVVELPHPSARLRTKRTRVRKRSCTRGYDRSSGSSRPFLGGTNRLNLPKNEWTSHRCRDLQPVAFLGGYFILHIYIYINFLSKIINKIEIWNSSIYLNNFSFLFFRMLATVVFVGTTQFSKCICCHMSIHECGTASFCFTKKDTSQKIQNKSKGSSSIYLINQLDIVLNCKTTCPAYSIKTLLVCFFPVGSMSPFSANTNTGHLRTFTSDFWTHKSFNHSVAAEVTTDTINKGRFHRWNRQRT